MQQLTTHNAHGAVGRPGVQQACFAYALAAWSPLYKLRQRMRSRMRLSSLVIVALHAAFDVVIRRINR